MPHARRIVLLEARSGFHDKAEKRQFQESAVRNSRHLAVSVQIFGLAAWLISRLLANPGATFDKLYTLFAVTGVVVSIVVTYASRNSLTDMAGRFACAAFTALAFHSNVTGTLDPQFWVLPMGVTITVGMAPVFSNHYNYLASALAVWIIISLGEIRVLMHMRDSTWVLLFVVSSLGLGLLLNLLFVQERKKTWFVQRELAALAFKDALTELPNRRSFLLSIEEHRARSPDAEAHLLLIDIDDFKQINDTSGHEVGDEALVAVARIIEACASPHVCGRLGGEEFAVIFSGGRTDALVLAQRICDSVAAQAIAGYAVTVSIGISRIAGAIGVPETFRLADNALYEAKRRGKNRCVQAEPT
jgi:diguanylate cyclase (GGDEF)-like protein